MLTSHPLLFCCLIWQRRTCWVCAPTAKLSHGPRDDVYFIYIPVVFLRIDSAIRPAPECPNIGIVMCLTTAPRYRDVNFVINYLKRLFDFDQLITLARQHAYIFGAVTRICRNFKTGMSLQKHNARMTFCKTNRGVLPAHHTHATLSTPR